MLSNKNKPTRWGGAEEAEHDLYTLDTRALP